MLILSADSCTEACSVALLKVGPDSAAEILAAEFEVQPRAHARLLPQMIDSVLQQTGRERQQLNALAVAAGPGAFTGIRIGMAYMQGLAAALQLPLIPISSLQAMALQGMIEFAVKHAVVAIDARMAEIYWAEYALDADQGVKTLQAEQLSAPEELRIQSDQAIGLGTGFTLPNTPQQALKAVYSEYFPHASAVARLASLRLQEQPGGFAAEQAEPLYLRNQVAEKPANSRVIV